MTDFVAGLIGRGAGLVPPAAPRPAMAPAFIVPSAEPPGGPAVEPYGRELDPEQELSTPAAPPDSRPAEPAAVEPGAAAPIPRGQAGRPGARVDAPEVPSPPLGSRAEPATAPPSVEPPVEAPLSVGRPAPVRPPADGPQPAAHPNLPPARLARPAGAPSIRLEPRPSASLPSAAPIEPVAVGRPMPWQEPAADRASPSRPPSRTMSGGPLPREQVAEPPRPSLPARPSSGLQERPEPGVAVRIGRIEVTLIRPPEPPVRPAPPAPASLERYALARRYRDRRWY